MAIPLLERAIPRACEAGVAGRVAVVIPLRTAPRVALPPVRLTRRGRLALTLAGVACGLAVTGLAQASAAATDSNPAPGPAAWVVVGPGDTLWEIALRADPHADPRITVARVVALNDLAGAQIRPGQRLRLPAGEANR